MPLKLTEFLEPANDRLIQRWVKNTILSSSQRPRKNILWATQNSGAYRKSGPNFTRHQRWRTLMFKMWTNQKYSSWVHLMSQSFLFGMILTEADWLRVCVIACCCLSNRVRQRTAHISCYVFKCTFVKRESGGNAGDSNRTIISWDFKQRYIRDIESFESFFMSDANETYMTVMRQTKELKYAHTVSSYFTCHLFQDLVKLCKSIHICNRQWFSA